MRALPVALCPVMFPSMLVVSKQPETPSAPTRPKKKNLRAMSDTVQTTGSTPPTVETKLSDWLSTEQRTRLHLRGEQPTRVRCFFHSNNWM